MNPPKQGGYNDEMDSNRPPFAGSSTVIGVPVGPTNPYYNENPQLPPYPQNPPPFHHHRHHHQLSVARWSTGLCDCGEDVPNCCTTCWCPCVTFGQIAEIVDEGSPPCALSGALYGMLFWFTGCCCLYSCLYRTKIRKAYMLKEDPCGDCLVHCCCGACALCQEYRELQNRGFEMSFGWEGNMRRQNREEVAVLPSAPPFEGGMTR